jgi:hypothetical protein
MVQAPAVVYTTEAPEGQQRLGVFVLTAEYHA